MTPDPSNINRDTDEQLPEPDSTAQWGSEYYDWDTDVVREKETSLAIAWSGIVIAAACFPNVIITLELIRMTIVHGFEEFPLNELHFVVVSMVANFFIGLIYGMIMSIPAFILTQILRWSLKGIVSDRGISGIYGGMTGFLCLTWGGWLSVLLLPHANFVELIVISVLAVVIGYVGAILAGYRKRNVYFPFYQPIFTFEKQITIGYLMKLTLIVAAFSVVIKAVGMTGLYIGIAWLAYLLAQTILLVCDHWFTRWLSRRELRVL